MSIDIASTSTSTSNNTKDLKNEVQYLKTVHTYEDKKEVEPSKVKSPPLVITIPDSDEASTTELEFSQDENTSREKVYSTSTVQQESPKNNEGLMFLGKIKNQQEKVSYLDNKRMHETAFSATRPTNIIHVDKDKKVKKISTRSPDTVTTSSIDHQKNLKEHKNQEDSMHEIHIYHKTILDYANHSHKNDAIDNCRYNHHNMIDEDYTGIIKKDLPILHNELNPISKKHLIQEVQKIIPKTQPDGFLIFRHIKSVFYRYYESQNTSPFIQYKIPL